MDIKLAFSKLENDMGVFTENCKRNRIAPGVSKNNYIILANDITQRLVKEQENFKNDKYIYTLYPSPDLKKQKFDIQVKNIYDTYYKSARNYVDNRYIEKINLLIIEEEELLNNMSVFENDPDGLHFMTENTSSGRNLARGIRRMK